MVEKHIEEHIETKVETNKKIDINRMGSKYDTLARSRDIIDDGSSIGSYDER